MPAPRKMLPNQLDELRRNLEQLKLYAMLGSLDELLEQAATLQQGYSTFFAAILEKEVLARAETAATRRIKAAAFPIVKTFDTFDWSFQAGLNVQLAKDLMSLDFVRQSRPVLLLGRPGTGKTHLSIAYGHLAALKGYKVAFYACSRLLELLYASLADGSTDKLVRRLGALDLLILDDLRTMVPKPEYASLLYEVVDARHGRRSTMLSSNLSVDAWGKALGDKTLTASIVDRLMERAFVLNIKRGRSYRSEGPEAPPPGDQPEGLELGDSSGPAEPGRRPGARSPQPPSPESRTQGA
jgi:DNA replication protein DnaC